MKLKKKILVICYLFFFTMLSNCVQSTVGLFGPALTGARTGNIYQSGFSYASSNIVKKKFGKTPTEYVANLIQKHSNEETDIDIKNITNPTDNIKFTQDYENTKDDHNNFVAAVKKMLK
jgi:pyruvate/oxaloacetate carboxyltransferase